MFDENFQRVGGIIFASEGFIQKSLNSNHSTKMNPPIKERRKHPRYTLQNSIMVNHDGVFQMVDISEGGFCFKCPPYLDLPDKWVAEILTPLGHFKECEVEPRWSEILKNGDLNLPSFMKFGVKFGQLTKEQIDNLTKLIGSISENPTDWEIDKGKVL